MYERQQRIKSNNEAIMHFTKYIPFMSCQVQLAFDSHLTTWTNILKTSWIFYRVQVNYCWCCCCCCCRLFFSKHLSMVCTIYSHKSGKYLKMKRNRCRKKKCLEEETLELHWSTCAIFIVLRLKGKHEASLNSFCFFLNVIFCVYFKFNWVIATR